MQYRRVTQHDHVLHPTSGGFRCDVCGGGAGQRWRCITGRCDWDACNACATAADAQLLPSTALVNFHPHPLASQGSGGYRCDGCGGSDNRRYRCSTGCDVDLCGDCFDTQLAESGGADGAAGEVSGQPAIGDLRRVAIHEHPLKSIEAGGAMCDGCRGDCDMQRWKCSEDCNYDLCQDCCAQHNEGAYTPPEAPPALPTPDLGTKRATTVHEHALELIEPGSAMCDGCRGACDDERWKCSDGCNYDLCKSCCEANSSGEVVDADDGTTETGPAAPPGTKRMTKIHEHVLEAIEPGSAMCDGCRGQCDDERWKCSDGCNYDLCKGCCAANSSGPVTETNASSTPAGQFAALGTKRMTKIHEHALEAIEPGSAMCDGCRGNCDDERWKCSDGCNYDLCQDCCASNAAGDVAAVAEAPHAETVEVPLGFTAVTSEHPHPLKKIAAGGSSCDLCGGRCDDERWQCSAGCNWDACGEHGLSLLSAEPASAPPASGGAGGDTAAAPAPVAGVPPAAPATSSGVASPGGLTMVHPHELVLKPGGGYSCDNCQGRDEERRYFCETRSCSYDLCGKCFDLNEMRPDGAPDLDGEDGSGWAGEPLYVRCVGLDFAPTRRGPKGAALVQQAVDKQQFGVLEYGVMWHLDRFDGAVSRLIDGVPEEAEDFEHKRSFGRDEAEETVAAIANAYSRLTTWVRRFLGTYGRHEAARATLVAVDAGLARWLDVGVGLRNKVAVMRLRDIHGRERGQDPAEGSSLQYGLDYELRQIKNKVEEGINSRWDTEDAEEALIEFTRQLDDLREWYALFRAQLGYLREAQSTIALVKDAFAAAKPHFQALCQAAGEFASEAIKAAGGTDLTGFTPVAAVDGGAGGAGGAAAVSDAPRGQAEATEQFPELPPPITAQPLDFSVGHSHAYIKALRHANSAANRATWTARRTGRFWRTFPIWDPAAFHKHIRRRASRDGGWSWDRFYGGDGLAGCRPMKEHLEELREALEDLEAAANEEAEQLRKRTEEETAARAHAQLGLGVDTMARAVPDGDEPAVKRSAHPELDALRSGHDAAAAAQPRCFQGWETAWQGAMNATKLDGAVKLVEAGLASANKWRDHAYGPGAMVRGQHYPHEQAHKEVAQMARKLQAKLKEVFASGKSGASAAQAEAWDTRLQEIAEQCDAAHVDICMKWGVESANYAIGEGPDDRYKRALGDDSEAVARLVEAQEAAKASYEARKAAEEKARRERLEAERRARAAKAAALAGRALTPFTGGALTTMSGKWTYSTDGPDGGHRLVCTEGRFAGSTHVWRASEDHAAVCLFGEPSQGMARLNEEWIGWISPVGFWALSASYAYRPVVGADGEFEAHLRHMTRWGMPARWRLDSSGGDGYSMVPVDNKAPSLVGVVEVTGSVPAEVALVVGMFATGLKVVTDERDALEQEREKQRQRMAKLSTATGSGGGSRVPPPGALYGKIEIVENFPDVTVEVVDAFEDIAVQIKDHFASSAGEWELVDHFADYRVQIVSHFADYKIKYVDHFPGVRR